MLTSRDSRPRRIVVRIDVRDGRVAHDAHLPGLRDPADPVELAGRFQTEGADEILFVDASESPEGQRLLPALIHGAARELFIPLIAGGGFNSLPEVEALLQAGARRVCLNDGAVADPDLLHGASERHGPDRIALAIEVREERRQIEIEARPEVDASHAAGPPPVHTWFRVFTNHGTTPTPLEAITWARRGVELGAGEIVITSIDRHGSADGYDLELTARMNEAVEVPVMAGGGAGSAEHIRDLFLLAGADAALVGSLFHGGAESVQAVKDMLADARIPVRLEPPLLT